MIYGCSSTNSLTQEDLRVDKNRDITVLTKDGRTIIFHEGEYNIVDTDYGSIHGRGKLLISEMRNEFRDWEGTITFVEIEKITSSQSTAFGTAGGILIIGAATLIAILILFPPKINFH